MSLFSSQQGRSGMLSISSGRGMTILGSGLELLGAFQQASSYRIAGAASMAQARYNAALSRQEGESRVEGIAYESGRILSAQTAQASSQGILGSKSALAIMSDTLHQVERAAVDIRNTSEQRAKNDIYQGQLAEYHAKQQANALIGKSIGNAIGTILGGF